MASPPKRSRRDGGSFGGGGVAGLSDRAATAGRAYSRLEEHQAMLEDAVRTESFKAALEAVSAGRIVMDLGCGTGILAIFAARAGARHVVAVEASPVALAVARRAASDSGVQEGVIEFFEGDVRAVAAHIDTYLERLPPALAPMPHRRVDVLVSEWMGFMLVHEGMFDAVAFARDRWLGTGGVLLPSTCLLRAAPFSHPEVIEEKTRLWLSRPYGVDLSGAAGLAWRQAAERPIVDCLPSSAWCALGATEGSGGADAIDDGGARLLAPAVTIRRFDCGTMPSIDAAAAGEMEFEFALPSCAAVMSSSSVSSASASDDAGLPLHGIAVWFDCELVGGAAGPAGGFSTGPDAPPTHWAQVLLFLDGEDPDEDADAAADASDRGAPRFQRFRPGDRLRGSLRLAMYPEACEVEAFLSGQIQRAAASLSAKEAAWSFAKRFELAAVGAC